MAMANANAEKSHQELAKAKGLTIVGFARFCRKCKQTAAYHAPAANWMNRVVCLNCGAKWSE